MNKRTNPPGKSRSANGQARAARELGLLTCSSLLPKELVAAAERRLSLLP